MLPTRDANMKSSFQLLKVDYQAEVLNSIRGSDDVFPNKSWCPGALGRPNNMLIRELLCVTTTKARLPLDSPAGQQHGSPCFSSTSLDSSHSSSKC